MECIHKNVAKLTKPDIDILKSVAKLAEGDVDEMLKTAKETAIRLCGMSDEDAELHAQKCVRREIRKAVKQCLASVENANSADSAEYPVLVKELRMARARHAAFTKKTLYSQ
jgi:predicted class III extradiol MEMO1 family dioxygenase